MTLLTKTDALRIISRAYGPEHAASLADRLPDTVDLDDPADIRLLFELGLSREGLVNALGGEL